MVQDNGGFWINASEGDIMFSYCIPVPEPIPSWNKNSAVKGQNEDVEI